MSNPTNPNEKDPNNEHNYDNLDKSSESISKVKISKDAWITLAILSSIGLVIIYGETMIIPAIPDLVQDFDIQYNTTAWILTTYLIAGAVATPIAGKLSLLNC